MTTALSVVRALPDSQQFLALFNRLCVALREPQDGTGVTQGVYWDALRDVPLSALEGGATRLMREQGRRWFPTVAEWRTQADAAREDVLRQAVRPDRTEPWREECRDCGDTGWVRGLTCSGDATCGRTRKHMPHDYTQACPCRATNRTYLRHQAFGGGAA
jgi:hypothetical protein